MAATRQTKVIDSNSNVRALGKVITRTKELFKTRVDVLVFYMEITMIGSAIFLALFLPAVFGIKTSSLKNEITQYDISISKISSKIEEINSRIRTIEVMLPKIKEIREDGKIYKIIGSNGK
ncbi:MAG: hypothetical protein J7K69_09000 [Thermotogae bacterium]|nr:hypothetical protein [Thermotogota bacterium]